MAVNNDDLIRAVFTATDETKKRALAVLQGRDGSPSRPEDNGPLLLSMGESANLLGVSRATLWRMIRAGRLEKVEIYHGAFRLRRADIIALVNSRPSFVAAGRDRGTHDTRHSSPVTSRKAVRRD